MLADELRPILLHNHRDLVGSSRCALQTRQQIQAIVLGGSAKIAADILLEPTADFVICQRRRKQDRQYTRQDEETEDATADAAVAFWARVEGQRLSFVVDRGRYRDVETGSTWQLDGRATSGPMAGRQLEQIADAFVSFWFAWAAFFPESVLWGG